MLARAIQRAQCGRLSPSAARHPLQHHARHATSMAAMNAAPRPSGKAEGDISDTFASLSGRKAQPLPDRFRQLKLRLVDGHEDAVVASWKRLLAALRQENDLIARAGPAIIPEVRFSHLREDLDRKRQEIRKRGVAVVRGVIPEDEARAYKFEIEEYARQNPHTRGPAFPYPPLSKPPISSQSLTQS